MRVLHVIPSLAAVRGGPSQAVVQMVRGLRELGVEAAIAATNDAGPEHLTLPVPLGEWIEYAGVPVQFFPRWSPQGLPASSSLREFALSLPLTQWLWRHVCDYDVLHIHAIFSYPCMAAMAIARQQRVPYIVRPLGSLCQWSLLQGARKKQLYLRLLDSSLNGAAALHCTSAAEAQEVAALGFAPPRVVIPLGLEAQPSPVLTPAARAVSRRATPATLEGLEKGLEEGLEEGLAEGNGHPQAQLLFLSRLHPKKGLEPLLQALALLGEMGLRPMLAIAGNGPVTYETRLRELVEQLGLSAQVQWLGFVQGEAKQHLLQSADLFVLPSHSENFGIAVLEALAAGTPALVTPGVALADLIAEQDLGWVVAQSPPAIASALQHVLTHPTERHHRGDRARAIVQQRFSWPAISQDLFRLYQHSTAQTLMHSTQPDSPQPDSPQPDSPMLDQITPVILTYNEAPNLRRTLEGLTWAKRIVIVDSHSTDETLEIIRDYPQAEVFLRAFDSHTQQWNYGINQARTDWVLSLDADYIVTDALREEIAGLSPTMSFRSYWIPFRFCVFGRPLRSTILPPRQALFHREFATYITDGHTQLLQAEGPVGQLKTPILHDDRKSLDRWLWAQDRYALLEVEKLLSHHPHEPLGWRDRLRRDTRLAPMIVPLYCLFLKGGLWDGPAGWYYAFQRCIAELVLTLRLIEARTLEQPSVQLSSFSAQGYGEQTRRSMAKL